MIRNFIFHRVSQKVVNADLEMDLVHFEKCIKCISARYQVVLLESIKELPAISSSFRQYATLTFDDGYLDNFLFAAPILEKYNCRGTFYIVSKCVEEQKPLWIHELQWLFFNNDTSNLNLEFDFLPQQVRAAKDAVSAQQKVRFFKTLAKCLKTISLAQKTIMYDYICSVLKNRSSIRCMMNWKELADLKARGHYIGAHSHSHNNLVITKDEEGFENEFLLPKQFIEKNLGYTPISFSYPFGFCDERVKLMTAKAGYKIGITAANHELYHSDVHNDFEIPRIALSNESWWKTRMRISNKIEDIKKYIPDFLK